MSYQSFEKLDVWQEGCRLAVAVHETFKDSKDYFMRDQILRSALSVPSNIAEGAERGSAKDTIRFMHIAKGSSAELRTQLYLSVKMGLVNGDQVSELIELTKKYQHNCKSLSTTSAAKHQVLKPKS